MNHLEYCWFIADFYYNNPNQYMSFLTFLYMWLSRTLAILFTLYNTSKFK